MVIKFGTPPHTRYNNLLEYVEIIAELDDHPGEWALVAQKVSKSDADKIVRTFRQMGVFEIVTRAAGTPGKDDGRDIWVRTLPRDNGEAPSGQTGV